MSDVEATLKERGTRYGDFADHARIAQGIKHAMCSADGWDRLPDMHKQSLETIADKIARILNGDPNYVDNWHDIQGYARLVEERLPTTLVTPAKKWRAWNAKAPGAEKGPERLNEVSHALRGDGEVVSEDAITNWDDTGDYENNIVGYRLVGDV